MKQSDEIRAQFGADVCGRPCSEAEIAHAEALLGVELPNELRELYLAFDGFTGPTMARFFWNLLGKDGLVESNRFLRTGSDFPHDLMASCIFFGDAGIGDMWAFKGDLPGQVIRWNPSWGDGYEIAGESALEAWLVEKQLYHDAEARV